jgi:uncharacterized protein YjeT (DUF2065 family)
MSRPASIFADTVYTWLALQNIGLIMFTQIPRSEGKTNMENQIEIITSIVMLVLGFSYMFAAAYWSALVRDSVEDPQRFLVFALVILVLGLIIIQTHNVWVADWEVAVTLIGWAMTVKAVFFLMSPGMAKWFREWSDRMITNYVRIGGVVLTLVSIMLLLDVAGIESVLD